MPGRRTPERRPPVVEMVGSGPHHLNTPAAKSPGTSRARRDPCTAAAAVPPLTLREGCRHRVAAMPDGHPAETVARLAVRAAGSAPRCGQTRVVAIDGPSGSGKSTLAAQLAEATRAPVLHMDDIYP